MNTPRIHALSLHFLILSFSAGRTAAQVSPPVDLDSAAISAVGMTEDVFFDRPDGEQGPLWARGTSYKARFDANGATYIPFLGSDAPRNFPVTFRLESISIDGLPLPFASNVDAALDGDVVFFDRGSVTELYAMQHDSMEQMFVFDSLPSSGDVSIRIRIESELESSEQSEWLAFSNDLGGVRYGRAVALGAGGMRQAAPTRLLGDVIDIHVPRAVLERAAYPLVIDPVISTFGADTSSMDDSRPDVSFMRHSGRWCLVWERQFSATDHDLYSVVVYSFGSIVPGSEVYIDATSDDWRNPSMAYTRSTELLLVAAEKGAAPNREIAARVRGDTAMGPQFQVNTFTGSDDLNPDVGGNPDIAGTTYFCVVWESRRATYNDVIFQLVHASSTLFGAPNILDDNSNRGQVPSISKSCGRGLERAWMIVWQREMSPTDHNIMGARVAPNGFVLDPVFNVHSSSLTDETFPVVSTGLDTFTDDPFYFVAWNSPFSGAGGEMRIFGRLLQGKQHVVFAPQYLSAHLSAGPGVDQLRPSIDSDGSTFVVAYAEESGSFPFIDRDVYVSSWSLNGPWLVPTEGPTTLANTAGVAGGVEVAAKRSSDGLPQDLFAAWTETLFDFSGNIGAAFYRTPGIGDSYCMGGLNSIGERAHISARGSISISSSYMTLEIADCPPNKPGLFFLGPGQLNVPFGEGFRCVGGQTKRIHPVVVTDASGYAEHALDFSAGYGAGVLPGPTGVNYQYWYRDPQGGPEGFNLTDGLHVQHTP